MRHNGTEQYKMDERDREKIKECAGGSLHFYSSLASMFQPSCKLSIGTQYKKKTRKGEKPGAKLCGERRTPL